MKILFVDDEKWRFDNMVRWGVIPPDSVHAADAFAAIDAVVGGVWDVIYLDHDLNTFVQTPYPYEVTGRDVARVVCFQGKKPTLVIVHSMNPVGAANIENALKDFGVKCIVKPFSVFADENLGHK